MQEIIIKVVAFIIVFGVIVAIHEYGHLFFAKRAGILVREYAVGMGPKLFAHRAKDGTLYTIRMIPVGGYVRMAGWGDDTTEIKKGEPASLVLSEDGLVQRINLSEHVELENALPIFVTEYDFDDKLEISGESMGEAKTFKVAHDATVIEEDGTELRIAPRDVQYQSATIPGKLITNFGGPLNNFILGLIAFIVLTFMQGGVPSNAPVIGGAPTNYPAYQQGLREGDRILSVNGKKVDSWTGAVSDIQANSNHPVDLEISRSGETKSITIKPEKIEGAYRIGITQSLDTSFFAKISGGFTQTIAAMTLIFRALGNLFTHPSLNQLGGPVAIFQATGQATQAGIVGVISFMAMLSINLGIVNLIPIPALDGGKIILNLLEAIRRKPLSEERETLVTMIGVIFMIALMIAVTWNDIMRLFQH